MPVPWFRGDRNRALVAWLAVLCVVGVTGTARTGTPDVAPPEYFGYNSARVEGSRPLLVILVEYEDVPLRTPPATVERLVFGPGYPNVVQYYRAMSADRFTWARAGVVGPFRFRDNPRTRWNEALLACWWAIAGTCPDRPSEAERDQLFGEAAVSMAFSAGFDFRAYDRNRDGRLTTEELGILVVGAAPRRRVTPGPNGRRDTDPRGDDVVVGQEVFPGPNGILESWTAGDDQVVMGDGASARGTCDRLALVGTSGTLGVCVKYARLDEWASVSSFAHELYHILSDRNWDLYGALGRLNDLMTLMAATGFGVESDRRTFQLDPFHKIQSGWVRPEVLRMRGPAQCVTLSLRDKLVVYDPARRGWATVMNAPGTALSRVDNTKEYFIFELRVRARGAYDGDIPGDGVAVWYVQTTGDNRPLVVPGAIRAGPNMRLDSTASGDDVAEGGAIRIGRNGVLDTTRLKGDDNYEGDHTVWLVSARESPLDGRRGGTSLWTDRSGEFELRWLDGSATGQRFRVGPLLAGGVVVEVEFNPGDLGIEHVEPLSATPGGEVTLRGHFGVVQTGREVILERSVGVGTTRVGALEVVSWSCRTVRVRVPRGIPPGDYWLRVQGEGTARSNPFPFRVVPEVRVETPVPGPTVPTPRLPIPPPITPGPGR